MIDLVNFYKEECGRHDIIVPETLERCDDDFEGIDFTFNGDKIVPEAIYKVLVLLADKISLECEGYVKEFYFLECKGKYYKIVIKYFQYAFSHVLYLEGQRNKDVCKVARSYNLDTRPYNHLKFWKPKCDTKHLETTL